jgi:hypothetical protein
VNAQNADEVTAVLHEEFLRWCGDGTAGPRQAYEGTGAPDLGCPAAVSEAQLIERGYAAVTSSPAVAKSTVVVATADGPVICFG